MTLTSRAFSAVQVRAVEERQGLRLPRKLWGVASQPLCTKPSLPAVVPAAATTDAAVLASCCAGCSYNWCCDPCQLLCQLQLQRCDARRTGGTIVGSVNETSSSLGNGSIMLHRPAISTETARCTDAEAGEIR
jgi:hypothetical protein